MVSASSQQHWRVYMPGGGRGGQGVHGFRLQPAALAGLSLVGAEEARVSMVRQCQGGMGIHDPPLARNVGMLVPKGSDYRGDNTVTLA